MWLDIDSFENCPHPVEKPEKDSENGSVSKSAPIKTKKTYISIILRYFGNFNSY
jgi:hypothetical protein